MLEGFDDSALLVLLITTRWDPLSWFPSVLQFFLEDIPWIWSVQHLRSPKQSRLYLHSITQWLLRPSSHLRAFMQCLSCPMYCLTSVTLLNQEGRFHSPFTYASFLTHVEDITEFGYLLGLDPEFLWSHFQQLCFIITFKNRKFLNPFLVSHNLEA